MIRIGNSPIQVRVEPEAFFTRMAAALATSSAAANSSCCAMLPSASLSAPRAAAAAASYPASRSSRRTRPSSPQTGAVRVSLASTCAGGAAELPAPLLPNARRRVLDPLWHGGGFSLGVDLGDSRTGLAVGRGITLPRPLTVLKLRGQRLELMLLDIARQQEADELIVGLPVSADGSETPQSNKVRSVVGRLAVQAAERGLRVYLQDEHGTSIEALDFMISRGVKKSARDVKSDAYAAVMILERYFSLSGRGASIVLPKQPELQGPLYKDDRNAIQGVKRNVKTAGIGRATEAEMYFAGSGWPLQLRSEHLKKRAARMLYFLSSIRTSPMLKLAKRQQLAFTKD